MRTKRKRRANKSNIMWPPDKRPGQAGMACLKAKIKAECRAHGVYPPPATRAKEKFLEVLGSRFWVPGSGYQLRATGLVLPHRWVDLIRPRRDPARQVVQLVKPVLRQ